MKSKYMGIEILFFIIITIIYYALFFDSPGKPFLDKLTLFFFIFFIFLFLFTR